MRTAKPPFPPPQKVVYPAWANQRKRRSAAYKPTAALDWLVLLGRFEPPEYPEVEDFPTGHIPTRLMMGRQSQKPLLKSPFGVQGHRCHAATTTTVAQNGGSSGATSRQGIYRPHIP
ncbi:Hypothetical predicted protein [Pelobates cultripes]|uniref:Uncharacterized protein n=1 Tax=Pelobates cultripes TaxID=61616 RepID=A0AAD1RH96_PELCU|nr:Hypothetical predicted protein [Pelobates cultripes]